MEDVKRFKIIVTYNGRCFDVPFIQRYFKIQLNQVHIDLRYILKSLGFSGGLKRCERQMGIDRGDLSDIDGYYAVILWDMYKRTGDEKHLKMLLDYNILDARNLERDGQVLSDNPQSFLSGLAAQGSYRLFRLRQRGPVDLIRGPVIKALMAPPCIVPFKEFRKLLFCMGD